MTPDPFFRPAVLGPDPARLKVPTPACSSTPVLVVDGMAAEITSPAILRKFRGSTRYVRVGSMELNLTYEYERGWPAALRLEPGVVYRAEVFECMARVKTTDALPLDAKTDDELVFYNIARERTRARDEADQRRVLKGYASVWTDGLMVSTSNTDVSALLKPGVAYKTIVRRVAASS